MKVGVLGLWHLGCVTAACLAKAGHEVRGMDADPKVIEGLRKGKAPLHEPGLDDLLAAGLASGKLRFESEVEKNLKDLEVLWVAFDTPVDDEDRADVAYVTERVKACLPHLDEGALVLVSSQLPAGTTASLAALAPKLRFAYSPENLRLGKALAAFQEPSRVVVGISEPFSADDISELLAPITSKIEWMSVPSAEMTKHAINAFLALSVVFINELGVLCEKAGADVKEVERGLKSEPRIGPKAYLGAGAAFAGGTLARDLAFLKEQAKAAGLESGLFESALQSNRAHMRWPLRKLSSLLGPLKGRKIGILGLAYKAGTDTLRRSQALELAQALAGQGAEVSAFDPLVKSVPGSPLKLASSPEALLENEAIVLMLDWPGLKEALTQALAKSKALPKILDPSGILAQASLPQAVSYHRVGYSS